MKRGREKLHSAKLVHGTKKPKKKKKKEQATEKKEEYQAGEGKKTLEKKNKGNK